MLDLLFKLDNDVPQSEDISGLDCTDYLVYMGISDGNVKYVGSGRRGRENHLVSGCSHLYEANFYIINGYDLRVKVFRGGLDKDTSLALEGYLIGHLRPCWNIMGMENKRKISREVAAHFTGDSQELLSLLNQLNRKFSSGEAIRVHKDRLVRDYGEAAYLLLKSTDAPITVDESDYGYLFIKVKSLDDLLGDNLYDGEVNLNG